MPRRSSLVRLGLLLVLVLGGRGVAGADEPAPEVRALLAAGEEQREAAHQRWRDLAEAVRAREALAALRSDDPVLARAGAVLVDPLWLDLQGLARLDEVLAADPLARFAPGPALDGVEDDRYAFGSAVLPRIWRALATDEREVDPPYEGLHRSLTHAHVAELVPLLATLPDDRFPALLWDIQNQAQGEVDDVRHDLYVRAFRYGLMRLAASAEGKPRPTFDDVPPAVPGPGIPVEAMDLVRASWRADGKGFDLLSAPQEPDKRAEPGFWLSRWLRRVEPVEADLDRLLEIAQMPQAPMQARHWAGMWAARFEGRAAGRVLQQILAGAKGDEAADAAAAEAAARGRPEAWRERVPDPALGWRADPPQALERAWRALQGGELPEELEPTERTFNAYDLGIEIPAAALSELAERLRVKGAPAWIELAFFARVVPEQMTVADAERILQRLEKQGALRALSSESARHDFAALEVRAPEALVATLRRLTAPEVEGAARLGALELLTRVGDEASADAAIAVRGELGVDPCFLGRLRVPAMREALRSDLERAVAADDADAEEDALQALAVWHGLPDELAWLLGPMVFADDAKDAKVVADQRRRVRELVLAGDPIGAVLTQVAGGGTFDVEAFAGFGRSKDPRVLAQLRAWRAAPESGLLWPATAALALGGDADARREWVAFLAEARTFLLDDVHAAALFTLDGDPELVAAWIERLSENCCYAWHAGLALKHLFPTAPWEQTPGDGGRACWRARAWWKENRGHLAWSRLADGWVPTAR